MTAADTTFSTLQMQGIAYDYTVNLAAAVQLLENDWQTLRNAGIIKANADPGSIENWYMPLWIYNTGFHAPAVCDVACPWGLGWTNNPADGDYLVTRQPFLRS